MLNLLVIIFANYLLYVSKNHISDFNLTQGLRYIYCLRSKGRSNRLDPSLYSPCHADLARLFSHFIRPFYPSPNKKFENKLLSVICSAVDPCSKDDSSLWFLVLVDKRCQYHRHNQGITGVIWCSNGHTICTYFPKTFYFCQGLRWLLAPLVTTIEIRHINQEKLKLYLRL